jgi:phenylalanyl-tRNA synthetase beta subunit
MSPRDRPYPYSATSRKLKSRVNFRVSDRPPGAKPGQKNLLVRVVLRDLGKTLTNETANAPVAASTGATSSDGIPMGRE